jgi:DNA repair exonuclease SbcCD ATPase subunit
MSKWKEEIKKAIKELEEKKKELQKKIKGGKQTKVGGKLEEWKKELIKTTMQANSYLKIYDKLNRLEEELKKAQENGEEITLKLLDFSSSTKIAIKKGKKQQQEILVIFPTGETYPRKRKILYLFTEEMKDKGIPTVIKKRIFKDIVC